MVNLKVLLLSLIISVNKSTGSEARQTDRVFGDGDKTVDNVEVCRTNDCQSIADELLRSLNKSADPCDDFYEYTCGGWRTTDSIPAYLSMWNRIQLFQTVVYKRIKGILEVEQDSSDILPLRQAKKWYQSCMDVENIKKHGLRSLQSILMHVGGWPMAMDFDEWDPVENSWQKVEQFFFQMRGDYVFYNFNPPGVDQNSGDYLQIKPGELPRISYFEIGFRDYASNNYSVYIDFIVEIAKMFAKHTQTTISDEAIRKDTEDLVEFEKALDSISRHPTMFEKQNFILNEFIETYETDVANLKLEDDNAKINFSKLLQNVFDLIDKDHDPLMNVTVRDLNYYANLSLLLSKTPQRTIVNYIHWHFVCELMVYSSEEIRDLWFHLEYDILGITEKKPRWLQCVGEMQLNDAAAYAFTKKYFSEDSELKARTMLNVIQESMENIINRSNLLAGELKEETLRKLKKMKVFIGFPEWYKNQTHVVNLFKGLNIGDCYMDNILSQRKFAFKVGLMNMFNSARNYAGWDLDPITINARYQNNIINVPVATLQPPLFTPNVPESVNYGISGVIIGHEMNHGFDNLGLLYDDNHEERKLPDAVSKVLDGRMECFANQFDKMFTDKIGNISADQESPGKMTLRENIADASGLLATYFGYMNHRNSTSDIKLPGFEEFTNEQMFFIAYGSVWCEVMTAEFAEMFTKDSSHSVGRLRLLGSVANTDGFARAFNCPKGSYMNPENKCNFWQVSEA